MCVLVSVHASVKAPRGDAPRLTLSTFPQVLERFGLNQLLHLEIDGAAWSAGNGSSLILHLLYGGFQLVRILVVLLLQTACTGDNMQDILHTSLRPKATAYNATAFACCVLCPWSIF